MHILYNEQQMSLELNATARDLAEKMGYTAPEKALVAKINGILFDLDTSLKEGDSVLLCDFDDPAGKETFWHTSAHVLAQAVLRLWPNAKPTIGPPIEQGFYYDFADLSISEEDFQRIEEEVGEIVKENIRPKRYEFKQREEAIERFKDNPYKVELIKEFEGTISGYQQGEFFDLCRGPHLPALNKIKAFKVLKTSGAYWRGDKTRQMLTRIYAISFPDRKLLKNYLFLLEEAKKRDHKVLGPKLGLFSLKEEAPGMPFIHPKGMIIWNRLVDFLRRLQLDQNYVEIKTPQLMSQELWQRSGHWDYYRDNMYAFEIESRHFALKPMNCPGCMLFYRSATHSYRELPLRIAEFGHVHRHEPSGALGGLFRVRGFHQDDAHIFMRPSDIKTEILDVLNLVEKIYGTFGLSHRFELSTRPEKSIGSNEDWELTTRGLQEALDESGFEYRINEGDGAFYGPKIDIHIRDALGRSWQCGTVQLDMSLPEKFQLEYVDSDGGHKRPIMIHRAIFGSVERFFGILIEHFAGKFPLWISPLPIRLIPVADRHISYAQQIASHIREAGLICDIDGSHESVAKKIREAQLQQINYMITLGDREEEQKTVSIRRRDLVLINDVKLPVFLEALREEVDTKSLTPQMKD